MKTPRLSRKPLDSHSKALRFSLNSSSNHTQGAPKPTQSDRNTQALINFARNKAIRSGNPDDVHAHNPWNAHRQIEYNLMKEKELHVRRNPKSNKLCSWAIKSHCHDCCSYHDDACAQHSRAPTLRRTAGAGKRFPQYTCVS